MRELAPYINWHDEDLLPDLVDDFATTYETLDKCLQQEVMPCDVVIGGLAVQAVLEQRDASQRSTPPMSAEVGIEYWAVTENTVTHVSKTRNDVITAEQAHQLASQVRRSGSWLPFIEARRTARLGRLAGASNHLRVAVFETDEPVNDQTMLAMRRIWGSQRKAGDKEPLYSLLTCGLAHPATQSEILKGANFDASLECFWKLVDTKLEQGVALKTLLKDRTLNRAAGRPTNEQLIRHAQKAVDRDYADMHRQALGLRAAARNVQHGLRVRPSSPLHNI